MAHGRGVATMAVTEGIAIACAEVSQNYDVAASGLGLGEDKVVPVADFFGADD